MFIVHQLSVDGVFEHHLHFFIFLRLFGKQLPRIGQLVLLLDMQVLDHCEVLELLLGFLESLLFQIEGHFVILKLLDEFGVGLSEIDDVSLQLLVSLLVHQEQLFVVGLLLVILDFRLESHARIESRSNRTLIVRFSRA